jgi:alkyldihydroxyacetonephosphate synthase
MYFSFGGVETGEDTKFDFYQKVWNATMEAVVASGGSIAHHHGIGINRTNWMEVEWGKGMKIMKEFKRILDPQNILNPGKVYGKIWKEGVD